MNAPSRLAAMLVSIVAWPIAGYAQLTPQQAYQAYQDADLAFQCAIWANVDDGRSIDKSEVERLTLIGYELSLLGFADIHDQSQGNYDALYKRAPVDFSVGQQWQQALNAVNRGLEYNVPTADHPFAELQELRAANASANFTEQGCADVGKP